MNFDEKLVLNSRTQKIQFSRRRPSSVRENDILICYGVGSTKLLGYLKVLSEPNYDDSDNSRWSWRVKTENLFPSYSQMWSSKKNTLSYVKIYSQDKVQLNLDFTNFLMNLIVE